MMNRVPQTPNAQGEATGTEAGLPRPTLQFRLKAWREFGRALDPLAPPKPLRQPRQH